MVGSFVYGGLPTRVVFGSGTLARLPDEVARLEARRVLVLTTPHQAVEGERVVRLLGDLAAGVYCGAVMHTPAEVTRDAMETLQGAGADCVVSLGGGSTIGLGKALALRTGVNQIAVPTTYAGSEMTPILGETKDGLKTTVRTLDVLPETVIYDVDLTLSLPVGLTGTSGINAIAHAVEALYAQDRNPIVSLMAEEGIRALAAALPRIVERPSDAEARAEALYGAWLCGSCLGTVGMALHHKLCHTLGGSFDLPHAETHTVVLPHAAAYNSAAAPEALARVATALGVADAPQGLFDLAGSVGAKRALKDLGMAEAGIEQAADLAVKNPYWNPRPVDRAAIRDLIARAWAGDRPVAA
ncbi:maleylacetate reductase [Phreatobacter stygius]|uniref:Maleylacetate reductase n=1 Tax=Phreatobacter stygius TaxID=1940610 RepID=A0A4D7B1S7_9HYPH|nr:maleylacetate reductase [Phreatobacter stygius]QCI65315.1 maleylacetate reductase [Phreatobacter stygius]